MGDDLSSDRIAQRVKELENGSLQDRFAGDGASCDRFFHEPIVRNMPVGFAYYDDQFVLQNCNRTYADYVRLYTPFSVEQALGMGHFDYKPGAAPYMEGWFVSVRNARVADTKYNLELRVTVDQKACVSYWDSHLEPVLDTSERLKGFLMCCIDRTDRNVLSQSMYDHGATPHGLLNRYEELKTVLRVLMRSQEEERQFIESKLTSNLKKQVQPILVQLKNSRLNHYQIKLIETIENQIDRLMNPLSSKLSSDYFSLTPTEVRIAGLIRDGLTSKEISNVLNVSKECIDFHRNNIRKKLGICRKKINMRTYLANISNT